MLPHEWTRTDTLLKKTKLEKAALSSCLTQLRRKGLVEYKGKLQQDGGLQWRRHPLDKPRVPPQEDVIKRGGRKTPPKMETFTEIADRIAEDLRKLRWINKQQEKQLKVLEEVKAKLVGDE